MTAGRLPLLLAGAALTASIVLSLQWMSREPARADRQPPAVVLHADGTARRHPNGALRFPSQPLVAGAATQVGDLLFTPAGARLVLRRPGGLTIHVAPGTELGWITRDDLRLVRGLVYIETVETADAVRPDPLTIVTSAARIRHLGTRYSVGLADDRLEIRVRDGLVQLRTAGAEGRQVAGGESGLLDLRGGAFDARPLGPDGGPWTWLAGDQPRFLVDGRRLAPVLDEIALLGGFSVGYADEATRRRVAGELLRGPPLELAPDAALDAALLAGGLQVLDREAGTDGTPRLVLGLR